MPVLTNPGFTQTTRNPRAAVFVVEAFEIVRESGLCGAIQDDRLATAIAGHRAEDAEGAAVRQEVRPGGLAEERWCARSRPSRDAARARDRLRAPPASRNRRRSPPRRRSSRVAPRRRPAPAQTSPDARDRRARSPRRRSGPRGGRDRCALRSRSSGARPSRKESIAALRELPGERAADPVRRAENDGVHGASPSRRTDCALRNRPCGSHRRRMACHADSRGSIAR